jgi:hypothetical protein
VFLWAMVCLLVRVYQFETVLLLLEMMLLLDLVFLWATVCQFETLLLALLLPLMLLLSMVFR